MLLFLGVNEQLRWLFVSSEAKGLAGMVYWGLHAQLGANVPHVVLNSTVC